MTTIEALIQASNILNKNSDIYNDLQDRATKIIEDIGEFLPSGSGFDTGTKILEVSDKQVVLETSFHFMDEHGFYDGWEHYKIYIKPSFQEPHFYIFIRGVNRRGIKDYIEEILYTIFQADFDWMSYVTPMVEVD